MTTRYSLIRGSTRERCSRDTRWYTSRRHDAPRYVSATVYRQRIGRRRKLVTCTRREHLCERCAQKFAEWHKLALPGAP